MCRTPTRRSCIGGALPAQSYLSIENIIAAAKASGADAVHPGYGFLAENAAFAAACRDAGLVFIGPSPEAIAAMGNKAGAKRLMIEAGVPCIPGYQGDDQGRGVLEAEAERIGFPVMIKAAAGGGGRGMRLVERAGAVRRGCCAARSPRRWAPSADAGRHSGKGDRRSAPHRDPGFRRPLRQRHPPRRTRLLDPAPPPEDHRGSAFAGGVGAAARRAWARPPSRRPGRSATKAPERSNSCSTATAISTSWR